MATLPLKIVHASVRPARVAILIDKADTDWQHTCLRIIEIYSQLWGGAYNIIVPTDGHTIDERFWTLLETFDPDYLYRYNKSLEDLLQSHPDQYNKILEREVESFLSRSGGSYDRVAAKALVDKELRRTWLSTLAIGPALQQEVKVRLAPFWFEEHAVDAGPMYSRYTPSFPLTDITKIILNTEHPNRVAVIEAPDDLVPRLWYGSTTGLLSPSARDTFAKLGITHELFSFREDNINQLVEFATTGQIGRVGIFQPNTPVLYDLQGITPYAVSMLELGLYRSTRYPAWQEPLIVVVGNRLEDFCLYYCLSRLRDRIVWALPSITNRAIDGDDTVMSRVEMHFSFGLRNAARWNQSQGGTACLTYTLTPEEVGKVTQQLNQLGAGQFGPQIGKVDDVQSLIRFPLAAIERDNFQRDIALPFSGDLSVSPFSTPKPKHFQPINPSEHRYITQLSVGGDAPPKHFQLGASIIPDQRFTTGEVRVGKDGPAYLCPNTAYFGGDIDTVLVRPRLHLYPLATIVEQLARIESYECRPSDKGIYADESISKWGGLEEVGHFFLDAKHRELLDRFLDPLSSKDGKGVYLSSDRRRYLDFKAIKAIVGNNATSLIDELIGKQILYRGFIFGCSFCRNPDWFSVSNVTQEFTCRRCGRQQVYTKGNWKMPDEPAWFYKLDELIYQGYRQGMAVSLLALYYLKSRTQDSFTFTTDREFWSPKASKAAVEADFFCAPDGVFTVGEAKSGSSLGDGRTDETARIKKYKRLVTGLSIRQLVFATMTSSWRDETVESVSEAFRDLRHVRLVFLDASQLLRR